MDVIKTIGLTGINVFNLVREYDFDVKENDWTKSDSISREADNFFKLIKDAAFIKLMMGI